MRAILSFIHRASLLLAVEMSLTCALSYLLGLYVGQLFQPNTAMISALWCMISAILVMQSSWSKSLEFGASRIIGSVAGSITGACIFSFLGMYLLSFCAGVFILVLLFCYFDQAVYLRLAVLTLSVIFIAGMINPPSELVAISMSRLLESAIGILITLLIRFATIGLHRMLNDVVNDMR